MTKPYIEQKPSRSARGTAALRALSFHDKNDLKGPDYLADHFLVRPERLLVRHMGGMVRKMAHKGSPGGYESLYVRTLNFDRHFTQALQQGFPQIVLLGAGYDTRAWRFESQLGNTRVFEMDTAVTLDRKKECLAKADIATPSQVVTVPMNFNRESLRDGLKKAGYDESQRALFILEGLIMFLAPEAVDATLAQIREISPPGSPNTILFDCIYDSVLNDSCTYFGAAENKAGVVKINEPYQFGIREDGIDAFFKERGFETLSILHPRDLEAKFLTQEGRLLGKPIGSFFHAHAGVVSQS